ncbi:hypothetical protein [Cumulibacter soli]|uniref:hypothetical protein n=1 Tax=Cumulibacter soli TaxID=2546344 RepID=UPI0010678DF6|nr:hypothetical protein [Cumulibacter soli]
MVRGEATSQHISAIRDALAALSAAPMRLPSVPSAPSLVSRHEEAVLAARRRVELLLERLAAIESRTGVRRR